MIVTPLKNEVDTNGHDTAQTLTTGERYFVYAIEKTGNKTWFYILNDLDRNTGLPVAYDASLFRTIESNVPDDWITTHRKSWFKKIAFTSFPEWANDVRGFYARLVDAEPDDPERKVIDKYYAQYETRITPPQT